MKHLWYCLSVLALLFAGCQKSPTPVLVPNGPTDVTINGDGGSGSISFTTNNDWTAKCSESWVQVSPSSGRGSGDPITVSVRCEPNTTYSSRSAVITITAGELSKTFNVSQEENKGVISDAASSYDLAPGAQTLEIQLKSNVKYTVGIDVDWIFQKETKALTESTLVFTVKENDTYSPRTGKITVNGGGDSYTYTVNQAENLGLVVEGPMSFDLNYEAQSFEVALKSNTEIKINPECDWIAYVETKALSSSTLVFSVQDNGSSEERQGSVTLSLPDGSQSQSITVKQAGMPAPQAVDMGLSVKWASFNVGATSPEEMGDFYSWGETELPCSKDWSTYKWCKDGDYHSLTKYCTDQKYWGGEGDPDGKTVLEPEDDAATVHWGDGWRTPTWIEWKELFDNSTREWTQQNGVWGQLIVSKINGESLFLASSGYYEDGANPELNGESCRYWSSSLSQNSPAAYMLLSNEKYHLFPIASLRWAQFNIRPVKK